MTHTQSSTTQTSRSYDSVTVKQLGQSRVEISGSIPADVWGAFRERAVKEINKSVSIDGFRKGMVPEKTLIAKVGEGVILEEMAELALSRAYVDILIDQKIDALGRPEIQVTKLAQGNPLEFKAVTAVAPTVTLPDYKKISAEAVAKGGEKNFTADSITDAELEDAITRIRASRVSHEGHDHDSMTPEEHDKLVKENLPELTDDFVKSLGEFADVADFKNKVREMVAAQKTDEAREKTRIRIADALVEATSVSLPDIMIQSELDRTQAQFESDIERMGVKLEDYLKHAKKSLEDIRAEWRPAAEKKAKLQLILNEIAKAEKIVPSAEDLNREVDHIVQHYKDADRDHAQIYAETVLTNEQVFSFLEK